MKIWLKRILIGLVVAFLVALVGIAIFLLTFDPNAYKNKLQEIVYARYERTLLIHGDIELSLFPRIGLSVQDVSLSDRGSSDLFASMESARLAVAIWPLMFNRLVVDHVAVSGLQAWLIRNEEGRYNFDDLVSRRRAAALPAPDLASPLTALAGTVGVAQAVAAASQEQNSDESIVVAASAAPSASSGSQPIASEQGTDLHIDIAGLTLRSGKIYLHDKKNGYVGRIADLELNTGRITADQAFDVAFRGRLLGAFPTADARFDGQALIKFNADQKAYSAQRVNVQTNGQLGDLQARSLVLRGSLAYSAYSQMFSASGLDFSVQGEMQGRDPVKNLEASLAVPQLKLDRSQAELHVERLSLRARGDRAKEQFQLGLDAPSLSVSPDSARGEPLTATVQREGGDERVALVLGMSGLGGNASELTLKELKLDGRLEDGEQLVQVNMTSPASWNMFEERGRLSAMRGDVRIEHPALPAGVFEFPFIGSMSANLKESHVRSELDAVLSGSKLAFRVGVKGFDRPQVDFALQADQLDFNTLFPAAAKVAATGSPAAKTEQEQAEQQEAAKGDAPAESEPERVRTWNLAFLRDMDLIGKFDVGELTVQEVDARSVHASIRAVEGKMEVQDIHAELYDGKLTGELHATADNDVALDLRAVGVSLDPLLRDLTDEARLAGKASLRAKLNSNGMTMPALRAALNGSAELRVRDGAVRGIDAAQTLRQVQELVRSVTKGEPPAEPITIGVGSETRFSELDADLQFTNGQGTIHGLNLVSPAVRVSQGKPASIDLVNQQFNVMVNLRVRGGASGPRDLVELRGVTVPVRITGGSTIRHIKSSGKISLGWRFVKSSKAAYSKCWATSSKVRCREVRLNHLSLLLRGPSRARGLKIRYARLAML